MTATALADMLRARRMVAGRWMAKCPAHPDRNPSLSIAEGENGHTLLKCHAGCTVEAILHALALTFADICGPQRYGGSKGEIFVAAYDYHDPSGKLVCQAVRYASPKNFRLRRPDGKGGWIGNMDGVTRVPFNLPAVIRSNMVLIAEGEKDARRLERAAAEFPDNDGNLSYAATCNIEGAGNWREEYSPYLAGKKVFVFQDNDDAGCAHAQQVCSSVQKYARAVNLVELPGLPDKGDVSDYLGVHTPAELFALMQGAPVWGPPAESHPGAPNGDKKSEAGFKLVSISDLLARPEVPPDYLVDGLLIRGTVSCLVSKPKVGKSTFARGLCLAVAKGEPFLGRSTWQGSCIYLALEERHAEIIADFRAMGADATLPIEVHADAAPASAILSLVDLLRQKRPALVVIDPLFRLAHIRDEKAYAEVYAALGPLIDLARETGTHIMVTHHAGKALKADAIDSPLGSTAIAGAAATTIVLGKRESYRTIQTVTRIGPVMAETMLTFDPITRLLSVGGTRLEADRHGCEEEILDYLTASGGQRTEPEIVKNVGYKTAVNRKALRSLFQNGAVTRSGDGKKGEPFKYSIACSRPLSGTEEQECVTTPQIAANTEQMLVPGSHDGQLLVPRIITGEGEPFFDVEV